MDQYQMCQRRWVKPPTIGNWDRFTATSRTYHCSWSSILAAYYPPFSCGKTQFATGKRCIHHHFRPGDHRSASVTRPERPPSIFLGFGVLLEFKTSAKASNLGGDGSQPPQEWVKTCEKPWKNHGKTWKSHGNPTKPIEKITKSFILGEQLGGTRGQVSHTWPSIEGPMLQPSDSTAWCDTSCFAEKRAVLGGSLVTTSSS